MDTLGVIFDEDVVMANVEVCGLKSSDGLEEIDEKLRKLDLSHLERGQQVQLRRLLSKH